MLIVICGKSGSGKTTLTNHLLKEKENVVCIDIDKIGHNTLENSIVQEKLIKVFGENILSNNSVDRKKLGAIVFNSEAEMAKLTDITWRWMEEAIDNIIKQNQDKIIVLDWILLMKTKYFKQADLKILLDIPYEIRKERVITRDKITEEKFELREKAAINYSFDDFDLVLKTTDQSDLRKVMKKI